MTTRTLLLMRHAEAASGRRGADHDRPLTAAGARAAATAGERIAAIGPVDHVLVSSALRTRETLAGLVDGGAEVAVTEERADLYEASVGALLEAVQTVPDDVRTLLVLGHAPGIPGLATTLASDPAGAGPGVRLPAGFAPATIVHLRLDRAWADLGPGQGDVVDVLVPGE